MKNMKRKIIIMAYQYYHSCNVLYSAEWTTDIYLNKRIQEIMPAIAVVTILVHAACRHFIADRFIGEQNK